MSIRSISSGLTNLFESLSGARTRSALPRYPGRFGTTPLLDKRPPRILQQHRPVVELSERARGEAERVRIRIGFEAEGFRDPDEDRDRGTKGVIVDIKV